MITNCSESPVQINLYLDGELDDEERVALEAHLSGCAACRTAYNQERWFLQSVRKARPFYTAPDGLRERIATVINEPTLQPQRTMRLNQMLMLTAAASVIVLMIGFWVKPLFGSPASADFARIAVDTHQRYTQGLLPLELKTSSMSTIAQWFSGKVPFDLQLPNDQAASGQAILYHLQGARLVGFDHDYAAYVAYQMGQHPISLMITAKTMDLPNKGTNIRLKDIIFNYATIADFQVVIWRHHDLTYALVSGFEQRHQSACIVCHQGAQDQAFIDALSLAKWI